MKNEHIRIMWIALFYLSLSLMIGFIGNDYKSAFIETTFLFVLLFIVHKIFTT